MAEGGGVGEPGFLPLGPLQAGQQVRRRVVGQVVLHQETGEGTGPGVGVEQDTVHGAPQGLGAGAHQACGQVERLQHQVIPAGGHVPGEAGEQGAEVRGH